jgi:hypothetical protein
MGGDADSFLFEGRAVPLTMPKEFVNDAQRIR